MKAYVTSIGEPTTELCVWALERNGFDVELVQNPAWLAMKLEYIYNDAIEEFLRVDADIVVNRNMTPELLQSLDDSTIWWWQFLTFDWFKQDVNHSMAYIKPAAFPALRKHIGDLQMDIRPETKISRIEEFHNPRRMATYEDKIMGLHGYATADLNPVKELKSLRGQYGLYDFELAERLNAL